MTNFIGNIYNNLDKGAKFIERQKPPKFTWDDIDNTDNNLSFHKTSISDVFIDGVRQVFKQKILPIHHKIFQKFEEHGILVWPKTKQNKKIKNKTLTK